MLITTNLAYVVNFEAPKQSIDIKGVETMTWNYRVVMIPGDEEAIFGEDSFVIREVFYDNDGEIEFWSEEDATPMGNTFEELCDDFDMMQEAFEKPILLLSETEDGEATLIEIDDEEGEEGEEEV